jgi:glycosyltransferase involved in cell wall biosynthesis
MQRVLIGVCTCLRPKMLERCLDSLVEQLFSSDIVVETIVVDNDRDPSARDVVQRIAGRSWLPLKYKHVRRRGIAIARNAVLDHAKLRHCFDWVAFIDDDEVADPDWIAALMAPEYRATPVLMGRQELIYPDPLPFWGTRRQKPRRREGEAVKTAYTNNVRFSTDLIGAGLRFNEALGLMGGEDQEFFTEAYKRGFQIRRTERAITHETVHAERLTYRAQFGRAYWCAASNLRRLAVDRGWLRAGLIKAHTVPISIVFGALEVLASPLFIAGGVTTFKRRALAGGKKIAKGLGRATAMTGCLPRPYLHVVGE